MKLIISPAKSLNFDDVPATGDPCFPEFLPESERLVKKLQKVSRKGIAKLMSVSTAIADLNYERFQEWQTPFTEDNSKPALMVFSGEVYRGMNARSFSKKEIAVAGDKLLILSGLYGLLKSTDFIQPYRLEMGTRFKVTPKVTNLYKFWGDKITDAVNEELAKDDGVLVNLASNEYFKSIDSKKIKGRIITCHFKDFKNGEYKALMTYAKLARGLMCRYVITNNITDVEHLKGFDLEGYVFNPKLSTEDELTFTRG